MLVKQKRQSSNYLLLCCKSNQASIPFLQIYTNKKKTCKMSLKGAKSTQKMINLTINHQNKTKGETSVFASSASPKISFNFLNPENKNNHKTNIKGQIKEFSLCRSQQSIKTEPNIVFASNQSKKTIAAPPKLIRIKVKSENQIQLVDQKIDKSQFQDRQSFKTQKLKTCRNQIEEKSTIFLQRPEVQLQAQKQSQIEFESSIIIKESSQDSRQNSQQQKFKDFHNSQNIEVAIKKWRKANTFTMGRQDFERKDKELHVSSNTAKIIKQEYKKGFLFQKVRKIDTKFYEAQQQSSSDRSEVIEDYKSMMSKIQNKGMQDSALIQI